MGNFMIFKFLESAEDTFESVYNTSPWAIILQSIYDLLPIILFLIGSVILLRCLYNKMVKGAYALFAAGSIMVFAAGFLKAMHKLIIGITGYSYSILDRQFTSTQSIGFALMFVALVGMFTSYNKKYTKVQVVALPALLMTILMDLGNLPEYDSTLPFIVLMIIGAAGTLVMMIIISAKRKDVLSAIFFGIAIIFMVMMGYLSTRDAFSLTWVAISVNVVYQALFMAGAIRLQKKGLAKDDSLSKIA